MSDLDFYHPDESEVISSNKKIHKLSKYELRLLAKQKHKDLKRQERQKSNLSNENGNQNNNENHINNNAPQPPGLFYFKNVFTKSEVDRLVAFLDSSHCTWSKVIARRQIFFGPVYYHTTHNLPFIQPLIHKQHNLHSPNPIDNKAHFQHINFSSCVASTECKIDNPSNPFKDDQPSLLHSDCINITKGPNNLLFSNPQKDQANKDNEDNKDNQDNNTKPNEAISQIKDNANNLPLSQDISQLTWVIDIIYAFMQAEVKKNNLNEEILKLFQDNWPDQILVNEYVNNLGISSHFDDFDAFGPYIITLSLLDPVQVRMKYPRHISNSCQHIKHIFNQIVQSGSILIKTGASRYRWRHGIPRTKYLNLSNPSSLSPSFHESCNVIEEHKSFKDEEKIIVRDENFRRISLTIRKLGQGRKQVDIDQATHSYTSRDQSCLHNDPDSDSDYAE